MIVGIDLGTSTSEIAFLRNGKPVLIREIASSDPPGILPSVVGMSRSGEYRVGKSMKDQQIQKPEMVAAEVKRHMGEDARLTIGGESFTPVEISAMILRHLKSEAEKYLGEPITDAVITVPAYFRDAERQATRDAGALAGLNVRRIINEPTAAALAYGVERPGVEEKILVYDLGGGTFDVTVLELSEGILDVYASAGDSKLGGKDIDAKLMAFIRDRCRRDTGIDLLSNANNKARLKQKAEEAKKELSSAQSATVILDHIGTNQNGDFVHFEMDIKRDQFEALIADLVQSTAKAMDEALAEKHIKREEIDTVLLVGGSTRIPYVRKFVSEFFGGRTIRQDVNPDEAVALGAAIQAGIVSGQLSERDDVLITDVSAWSMGIAVVRHDGERYIPDSYDCLVPKNTTVPVTRREKYSTISDDQDSVIIRVYQGDAPNVNDNELVARFELGGIPAAPAGEQDIEIELSYNADAIVVVTGRICATGEESSITIDAPVNRLNPEQINAGRDRLSELMGERPTGSPQFERSHSGTSLPSQQTPDWRAMPAADRFVPLIAHAEKTKEKLGQKDQVRVEGLLNDLKGRILSGDLVGADRVEATLTDFLFRLE